MVKKRRSRTSDNWWDYPPNRPIEPSQGIKAQSQYGKFVANWWANRWIAALKELMDSGRLSRGRSYARRGQVLEIDVQPGQIAARVQGSRLSPYQVHIHLKPLNDAQWDSVLGVLSEQALFAAQLLNGEMPQNIEQAFQAVSVPLFPESKNDLQTSCSCPDWANPCKHIAAVYYLMGERFDQDPFLLFQLRGRDKEQVIADLREHRAQSPSTVQEAMSPYNGSPAEGSMPDSIADHVQDYWSLPGKTGEIPLDLSPPAVRLAILKRLGPPRPLQERGLIERLQQACDDVAAWALDLAFSDLARTAFSEDREDDPTEAS